jgi:exodeoxyribonuclease VII large subunit
MASLKIHRMQILTVSELTAAIKTVLEPTFRGISVKGEISNFKLQSSGHLYFSLKDAGAQVSAVLFRGSAARLSRMPKDGDQVVATGELSLYAPRGQYQIVIREVQFLGMGELLLKFHQLKTELSSRGWFDKEKKKPLPKFPKRIGVVTSPTGAVIKDILNVLKRRFPNFHLILNPVRVQGDKAPQEIARAIAEFNLLGLVDVMIVARGGGSIEDLFAFNEEIVAKAIFESKIPVISAVGHETDFTIADWVADVRAPTPSAAAEIVVAEQANLLQALSNSAQAGRQFVRHKFRNAKEKLFALKTHPIFRYPQSILSQPMQQLDVARLALRALDPREQVKNFSDRIVPLQGRLGMAAKMIVAQKKERLAALWGHLQSLNPNHILKKGYAILFNEKGSSIILSSKNLEQNQTFIAHLHDGHVTAVAKEIKRL